MRRVLFRASLIFPWSVSAVLSLLAVYPMLFKPGEQLTATLAGVVGGGLSFASVAFAAATSRASERAWSVRMASAGSELLQFSIAMAVALSLNVARERFVLNLGSATIVDYALRGLMATVTIVAIGMSFLGFRAMVLLYSPSHDEPLEEATE